jgi:hypothetical protein
MSAAKDDCKVIYVPVSSELLTTDLYLLEKEMVFSQYKYITTRLTFISYCTCILKVHQKFESALVGDWSSSETRVFCIKSINS